MSAPERLRLPGPGEGRGALGAIGSRDLDVNAVSWPPGAGVEAHVNPDLDVLVVVTGGSGTLSLDGEETLLRAGEAVIVPAGARRAIRAGADGIAYLTAHRRRERGLRVS